MEKQEWSQEELLIVKEKVKHLIKRKLPVEKQEWSQEEL